MEHQQLEEVVAVDQELNSTSAGGAGGGGTSARL